MSAAPDAVAIVTGASQGIGEGVVAAFRRAAYAVVGTSRSIPPSDDPGFVTVRGDIAEPETTANRTGSPWPLRHRLSRPRPRRRNTASPSRAYD